MPKGNAIGLSLPTGGLRRDLPRHFVPDDASFDMNNCFVHQGELITRYGMRRVHSNFPSTRIMGIHSYFYLGSPESTVVRTVVGTTTGIWAENGPGWTDVSQAGNPLTGDENDHVRMIDFPISGVLNLLATNNKDAVKKWNSLTASDYADLGGSPPIALDICACANQVILGYVTEGGIPHYSRLRISSVNNPQEWPATKVADLTGTADSIIGLKLLTRTAFVIYKKNSQWLGTSQPGSTLGFRFEIADTKPGPISTAAIVDTGGVHYYLASDFRIYRFDGSRAQEVFSGLRPWIKDNLNFSRRWRAHGTYFPLIDKIIFLFPVGSGEDPTAGVILDPATGAGFPFSLGFEAISASGQYLHTYAVTLGGTTGNIFIHDEDAFADGDGDAGEVAISAYWEAPLRAYGGIANLTRVHYLDTFFKQAGITLFATVSFGTTDTLATAPTFGSATQLNVASNVRHKIPAPGVDLVSRFITVKHTYQTSAARVHWVGGVLLTDSVSLD